MTQKTNPNPWLLDVRVRERNLNKGLLTDKEVEKHLAGLPDVADQAESFAASQPALREPDVDEDDDVDDDADGDGAPQG
jgi:hypothetical protein